MTYGTISLVHKISGITSSSISSQSSFTASILTHYKYTATIASLTIQIQSMIAEPHSLESPKTELAIPAMVELNCALTGTGINHVKLLPASNDDHGGVIVDMREPVEPDFFLSMLRASMLLWRQQEKRGVWIKLPIELVNLVETAVKEGFCYHHAEPSYLMLVYWIPETASTIPANASHRVCIGAIVWNDKRELLVVQEKIGIFRGAGVWKIPTGVVDEGEDIFMAATREVKEETGIDTEFQEILAFRQSHNSFFGKSDLFFLCFLHPKSFDIQKQELEIEAAQWMPLEEYAAQPFAKKHELFKYIDDLCLAKVDRNYAGFSPLPLPTTSIFNDRISYLYSNIRGLKLSSPDDHK